MFLTPDGKPMYGGTYWPPEPRWGRPSFRQVLESVNEAWRTRRAAMEERGLALADHLARALRAEPGRGRDPDDLTRVGDALHGRGRSRSRRHPRRAEISQRADLPLLLERDVPPPRSGFGEAVRALLEAMSAGGIYDHLGGGYARYSTDADLARAALREDALRQRANSRIAGACSQPVARSGLAERARETVGWLMREMRVGEAFAASLDADQDGEEGSFYVWREDEIDAALGAGAPRSRPPTTSRGRQLGRPHASCGV